MIFIIVVRLHLSTKLGNFNLLFVNMILKYYINKLFIILFYEIISFIFFESSFILDFLLLNFPNILFWVKMNSQSID